MNNFLEIGFGWVNAWIGSLLVMGSMMATTMPNKKLATRMMDMSWYGDEEKKKARGTFITMYLMMFFTIVVPLKTGTPYFYIGLAIFILGFIGNGIATFNYAATPRDEPVKKGMYQISRNPLYLCFAVMYLGLIVASLSLPLLIIWIIYSYFTHGIILAEEGYCLKTYADSYEEYQKLVPRYLLFI